MVSYVILIVFLYVFRDFLGMFFMIFLFAYLFYSMAEFLNAKILQLSKKFDFLKFMRKIPFWIIILLEYLAFIGIIIYFVSNIIPTLKVEINSIVDEFSIISELESIPEMHSIIDQQIIQDNPWLVKPDSWSKKLIIAFNDFRAAVLQKLIIIDPDDNLQLAWYIENFGKNLDFKSIGKSVVDNVSVFGGYVLNIILALVLSFIFIIDRKKLWQYLYKVKESNLWFFYTEYEWLLDKVAKSFWLILKAQSMIALANAILTVIGLIIIGFVYRSTWVETFPYILTLALVVFVFWFIPVLWVVLSSIPIMVIAYMSYQEPMVLVLIVLMIVIIHMIEAYYLNPKIVSSFLELPVSLTFIILIVSEHFFWFAWLLIWISGFYFFVSLIKDFDAMLGKRKKKLFSKLKW